MANFTVTIANGAPMLGMSPTSGNWNALTWNAFLWGYTLDLQLSIGKSIVNTEAPDTAQAFFVTKGIVNTEPPDTSLAFDVAHAISETEAADSAIGFGYAVVLTNSQTITGDLASETLQDPNGYFYVFPSNATNAEDRDFPTWTSSSAAASSIWTSAAVTSTTWS